MSIPVCREKKSFKDYCAQYLQRMNAQQHGILTDKLLTVHEEQWISIREKWIKMRAYVTRAVTLLMEDQTDENIVFALFSREGCLLKLYGLPEKIDALRHMGIDRKTLWNIENAGPNAVSVGLEEETYLNSIGQENYHALLKPLAVYFTPIIQNSSKGSGSKTIGGLALIVPVEKQTPGYEMLVRAVAQTAILQLDTSQDLFSVYAQSEQCMMLLDINQRTGHITINHHNQKLFDIFQLPQTDLYFKHVETAFDPAPKNEQLWCSIRNELALSGQEMMISAHGREINCSVTLVPRNRPSVASKSVLMTIEPFQQSIDTISKKINNNAVMGIENIIGRSPQIHAAIQRAKLLSNADSNVMIFGESGVGKDVFAQALHNAGKRKNKPFIAVNCAALPRDLIGSELFGYESGAFTGAKKQGNIGKFELANGGTIFLDEIGEMPLDLQATLLRVVEQKKLMRLGGNNLIDIDVKIVSATNANIPEMIEKKQFRADLYYRLSTVSLNIPPLRERGDDIILLAEHFIRSISKRIGKDTVMTLSPQAKQLLLSLPWKGNVRELQNLMECLVQLYDTQVITPEQILENTATRQPSRLVCTEQRSYIDAAPPAESFMPHIPTVHKALTENEIQHALQVCAGNRSAAARYLGIARKTLYRNMERLQMETENSNG